jgi:hypothetical protein
MLFAFIEFENTVFEYTAYAMIDRSSLLFSSLPVSINRRRRAKFLIKSLYDIQYVMSTTRPGKGVCVCVCVYGNIIELITV